MGCKKGLSPCCVISHNTESAFAPWTTTHNQLKHCGPQHRIWLSTVGHCADTVSVLRPERGTSFELDKNQIPCVSSGYLSMCMWQYIHMHVAMYTHGHVFTYNLHTSGCVSTSRIWLCAMLTWPCNHALCIRMRLAVYPHARGHVFTCSWQYIHMQNFLMHNGP